MTQKSPNDSSVSKLLQTIDPSGIAARTVRRTVEILLNLIEELNLQVQELREENQRLRSENNRLKGEQGTPEIKAKKNFFFLATIIREKSSLHPFGWSCQPE